MPISHQLTLALREQAARMECGGRFPAEREVAERFDVSQSTAAKAINQLVADGLLYRIQGRGTFVNQDTETPQHLGNVLMLIPRRLDQLILERDCLTGDLVRGVIEGLGDVAHPVLASLPQGADEKAFCASRISAPSVDGIVFLAWQDLGFMVQTVTQRRRPFALLNVKDPRMQELNSIVADEATGMEHAVDHLWELGHRHIAYVHKPRPGVFCECTNRQLGFQRGIEKHGVTVDEDCLIESKDAMPRLLAKPRPTALVCSYDGIAMTLIPELQAAGIRVPEDISVIGFDDGPEAAACRPGLTTIRKPRVEMGRAAARLVMEQLRNGFAVSEQTPLKTELVVRESCAPPAKSK